MMREMEIFNLSGVSSSFATRAKGQEVVRSMCDVIAKTSPKTILVDWYGVSAASPSFIDEFVNGLQGVVHTEARCSRVLFTRADPAITSLLNVILARRAFDIEYAEYPGGLGDNAINVLGTPINQA